MARNGADRGGRRAAAGALAALPEGVYWLPEALAEGDYYWRWLLSDLMPVLLGATTGIGCLFGAQHIRTSRRMRKKIDNIVGDAKYMYIQDIASAVPCSYEKCCKYLESYIDEGVFGLRPTSTCAANAWW